MMRKITLLFLLAISFHITAGAQTLDAVSISIPPFTDTTCPGSQLMFTAMQSVDTFSTTSYHWYTDNVFTGVTIDTFYTTALVDGDSVYCKIYYTNSAGTDSAISNTIIIHRSPSIPPGVVVALTTGSNPYCTLTSLTFTAFPINGGTVPSFQWMIDGVPILGEDSSTISRVFAVGDTVSCRVVSNSLCLPAFANDTVYSTGVPIVHDSLTAGISITVSRNPICAGTLDTFTATVTSPGSGSILSWYVDSSIVPSAIGPIFIVDSLHNGSLVYCELTAPDPCVINHNTVSNVVTMTVITDLATSVYTTLTGGSNPGCLDSLVQFTGYDANFGSEPALTWYVNSLPVATGPVLDTFFANGDTVTFRVNETDNGCYNHDTLSSYPFLMIRDSTPQAPLVSLIGNLLETNSGGSFVWYFDSVLVPGVTGQIYHTDELGFYYAIKDTGNCPSLPSNVIYISLLKVNNINTTNISIFPNPTSGILNIDWGENVDQMAVDIYNIIGQHLVHNDVLGQSHLKTDLSYLPDDNYIVVLKDQDGNKATFKVLLSKNK